MSKDTLESLVKRLPAKQEETFTIDMSRFFPPAEGEKPVTFTYSKLRVNQLFGLEEMTAIVKGQRPEWSNAFCLEVATIAACHKEPKAENPTMTPIMYCHLYDRVDEAEFLLFTQEFDEKAGGDFVRNLTAAVAGRKKN